MEDNPGTTIDYLLRGEKDEKQKASLKDSELIQRAYGMVLQASFKGLVSERPCQDN